MHQTLVKSIPSNHTLLVSEVDYKLEELLFEKLKKNHIDLKELEGIKNKARRIEWMTVRSVLLDFYSSPVDIRYDSQRKPLLKNQEDSISISHSHHKIAISLKKDQSEANGIDIQHLNPKIMSIIEKFLNAKEIREIEDKNIENLGYYWSIKEALFKVYGKKDIFLKEHISIEQFDSNKQFAIGRINCSGYNKAYQVHFELIDNYTLAYIVNG